MAGNAWFMAAVKWYSAEVKYSEVWESVIFLCFKAWDECMGDSPETGPRGSPGWPRTHVLHTNTLSFSWGAEGQTYVWTSAPSSLPPQSKPHILSPPKKGVNRSGSVSRHCGWIPTPIGMNDFSFLLVLCWAGGITLWNKVSSESCVFFAITS